MIDPPMRSIEDAMIPMLIAGAVSAGCYLCYTLSFESLVMPTLRPPGTPVLSYGQQFGIVMLPLAALLGCSAGASFAVMRWWATIAALAFPALIAVFVTMLWKSSFTCYGADPSDWVLYVPLLVGSAICIPLNIVLAMGGYWYRVKSLRRLTKAD